MSDISAGADTAEGGFSALSKKWGPLPVWGWGLIAGGLGVAVYWYRSRQSTTNLDSTTTVQAGNPVTGQAGYSGTADTSSYQTDGLSAPVTDTSTQDTNVAWLARAVSAVSSATGASPTVVTAALQKWIAGGASLTPTEQSYVDKAEQLQGLPPEGLGATPSTVSAAGAYTSYGTQVSSLYQALLGRTPTAAEANSSTAASLLASGHSTAYVADWIKKSAEYKAKHPTGK